MPSTPEERAEMQRIKDARRELRREPDRCRDCGYISGSQSCYEECGIKERTKETDA